MSQTAYLIIAIVVLVGLGLLALSLFLMLRRDKVSRKKCQGCDDMTCPLAKALEEKNS